MPFVSGFAKQAAVDINREPDPHDPAPELLFLIGKRFSIL